MESDVSECNYFNRFRKETNSSRLDIRHSPREQMSHYSRAQPAKQKDIYVKALSYFRNRQLLFLKALRKKLSC